ncbi:MAG: glycoside hydrolase family 3 C-terminal domain-containing protein, partial [Bifidobacteriaceae bacterium]|nr:glycoside hydrolase family 3 C-terminal domain-containing protein [Bifidobacteriaceae bacterium]
TFTPDGIGWEIRSNFSGVPTFYARDTMSGTFTVENFDIPATANLLRLNISGTDLLDKLDATDPNCVSAGAPDVGCPTIASFGVTINGVTRTYPVNRQAYTNQTTSAAAETYMPMIIPLADFSGVAGTTVDVQFSFSVALPGGGGSTGVNLSAADQTAIQNAENVIVYVGTREADSNEEVDRPVIDLPRFQADLVNAAIALNPNTVVYMQSVGQVNITPFKDAAKAIIWTTYNGQYQGQAAAELLFAQNVTLEDGRQVRANPSGHLTWTFYSDVDAQLGTTANGASKDYSLSKAEGSLCGRTYWYYQSGTTGCAAPDFPFGHGLSYSTFTYSNVALSKATASPDDTVNITATVTNTGSIPGREVVQVYASSPQADGNARPYKQVKGFEKTGVLEPNASETVTIPLKASDLWFWDTATQKRVYDQGTWKILVGPSSDSARGTTLDLAISGAITGGVDVVAAVPDGVALNTATPGNVINANVSATKHDQSFWDLASSAVKVEYSSGDRSVATVNSSGVVSPVGAGATLITVKVTADGETESTTFPVAVHEGRPTAGVTNWTSPSHVAGTYTALPAHTAYNFMVNFANQNVTLDQAKAGVQLKAGATTPDIVGYEYLIAPMDLNEIGATITPDGVLTATKTGQVQVTVVVESDQKISRHALITVVNSAAQVPGDSAKLGPIVSAASVLTAGPFSPESWSALQTALANAKAVAADKTAPQSRIDAAAAALNAALAGLKPVPAKATEQPGGITAAEAQRQADVAAAAAAAAATKTALAAVTADAEALVAKAGAYTPASVQAVQAALATAKTVGANPAATPAEVQAALTALSKAVAGLVPAPATVKAGTVKITGTAKVGKTLKAKVAKWTKGTAYSYRWYAGSKVIKNATGASLKITKALKGKKIKVRVTGTKSGLVSSIKTSKATKKIK